MVNHVLQHIHHHPLREVSSTWVQDFCCSWNFQVLLGDPVCSSGWMKLTNEILMASSVGRNKPQNVQRLQCSRNLLLVHTAHMSSITAVLPRVTPGPKIPPSDRSIFSTKGAPSTQQKEKGHKEFWNGGLDGRGQEVAHITSTHIPLGRTHSWGWI